MNKHASKLLNKLSIKYKINLVSVWHTGRLIYNLMTPAFVKAEIGALIQTVVVNSDANSDSEQTFIYNTFWGFPRCLLPVAYKVSIPFFGYRYTYYSIHLCTYI